MPCCSVSGRPVELFLFDKNDEQLEKRSVRELTYAGLVELVESLGFSKVQAATPVSRAATDTDPPLLPWQDTLGFRVFRA